MTYRWQTSGDLDRPRRAVPNLFFFVFCSCLSGTILYPGHLFTSQNI